MTQHPSSERPAAPSRVPGGVPSGGQFAASTRPEATLALRDGSSLVIPTAAESLRADVDLYESMRERGHYDQMADLADSLMERLPRIVLALEQAERHAALIADRLPCQGCTDEEPAETCPRHGRTVEDWIERGDVLDRRLTEKRETIDRVVALVNDCRCHYGEAGIETRAQDCPHHGEDAARSYLGEVARAIESGEVSPQSVAWTSSEPPF